MIDEFFVSSHEERDHREKAEFLSLLDHLDDFILTWWTLDEVHSDGLGVKTTQF